MSTQTLTNVDRSGPADATEIAADKLISGTAATQLWNPFSDSTSQFHVGQWSSQACKLSVSYDENELCVILDGTVRIETRNGDSWTYNSGDAFVIPAGFIGTWESVTPVRKIYAAFEAN